MSAARLLSVLGSAPAATGVGTTFDAAGSGSADASAETAAAFTASLDAALDQGAAADSAAPAAPHTPRSVEAESQAPVDTSALPEILLRAPLELAPPVAFTTPLPFLSSGPDLAEETPTPAAAADETETPPAANDDGPPPQPSPNAGPETDLTAPLAVQPEVRAAGEHAAAPPAAPTPSPSPSPSLAAAASAPVTPQAEPAVSSAEPQVLPQPQLEPLERRAPDAAAVTSRTPVANARASIEIARSTAPSGSPFEIKAEAPVEDAVEDAAPATIPAATDDAAEPPPAAKGAIPLPIAPPTEQTPRPARRTGLDDRLTESLAASAPTEDGAPNGASGQALNGARPQSATPVQPSQTSADFTASQKPGTMPTAARSEEPSARAAALTPPAPPVDGEALRAAVAAASVPTQALPQGLSRGAVEATAQIAAQILRRFDGRATRFDMALTPESLGRVDVRLEIGDDGALTARLAFDNPASAADMRARGDELRRQLEEAGFRLGEDALQFSERDPSSGRRAFDDPRDRAFTRANRLNDDADTAAAPVVARWTSLTLSPERVDLKV